MANLKTGRKSTKLKATDEFSAAPVTSKSDGQAISSYSADDGSSGSDYVNHPDVDIADQILSQERFDGHFDAINKHVAEGWAYSLENPTSRARVEIWAGDTFLALGFANVFRSDLADAKIADGCCAFEIPLPESFEQREVYSLSARIAETDFVLPGGPIEYSVSQDGTKFAAVPFTSVSAIAIECAIDLMSDELLTGWVYFPLEPMVCPVVHMRVGGRIVARAEASKFRHDLLDAGKGDGCHAFELQMPIALLDGEEHLIDVTEEHRGISLTKSSIRWRSTAGTALPHVTGHSRPIVAVVPRYSAMSAEFHASRSLVIRHDYIRESSGTRILIDMSDLIYYLGHHANLTGIQRVQSSVVLSILGDGLILNSLVTLLSFDARAKNWVTISTGFLLSLLQDLFLPEESRLIKFSQDEARFGLLPGSIPFDGTRVLGDSNPSVLLLLGAAWVHQDYMHRVLGLKRNFGTRFVMTVHDLIPIYASDSCDQNTTRVFNEFMRRALVHVDHILAVSENTAADLRRYLFSLRLPEPPITVTKNGSSFAEFLPPLPSNARTALDIPERFVLFVATIEGRKNHQLMYDIWRRLIDDGEDPPTLICVGRLGWKATKFISSLVETNYLNGRVLLLRDISDTDLRILYYRCMFTVYPTLYEGWGLPVGESLALGRICVSSDRSSLPEVTGDCGVYIDIDDFEGSLDTIQKLISNCNWRAQLESKIRRSYVPVTWRQVAEKIVAACDHSVNTQWEAPYPYVTVPYSREVSFGKLSNEEDGIGEALLTRITDARVGYFQPDSALDLQSFNLGEEIRSKGSWAQPETWGTWLCHSGGEIEFALTPEHSQIFYVHVRVRICGWLSDQLVKILANGECIWEGKIGHSSQDIRLRLKKLASLDRPWRLRLSFEVDVPPDVRMQIAQVDTRVPSIGLERLIIVPENDVKTRLDLWERRL